MSHSFRPLIRPHLLAAFVQEARRDLDRLHDEHERELAAVKREIADLREILHDVTVVLCEQADQKLANLRKQLEIALIKLAPRDGRPLN
jgi:hypothetical protein